VLVFVLQAFVLELSLNFEQLGFDGVAVHQPSIADSLTLGVGVSVKSGRTSAPRRPQARQMKRSSMSDSRKTPAR
jgi:hypothetical protein